MVLIIFVIIKNGVVLLYIESSNKREKIDYCLEDGRHRSTKWIH